MTVLPVAIMSFDRPDYLEGVLQTLARQIMPADVSLEPMLFQDGALLPDGKERVAEPVAIRESVEMFKRYFPSAPVFDSEFNLGVAQNFDRAERYLFVNRRFPAALFLEDDMILSPHYIDVICGLLEIAFDTGYIGVVTGYGSRPDTPIEEQRLRARELCLMDEHNWAFALTRDCWIRRDEIVSEYLEIISDVPYRDRSLKRDELESFFARYGKSGRGYKTSQDSVKNMAMEVLGIHRVSTWTNNARYIGRKGLHMTADRFARRGYDHTVLYPDPPERFHVPTLDGLDRQRVLS